MRLISTLILISLTVVSCKKDDPTISDNIALKDGMMVMCEGLFQQNNSSLSFVNFNNDQSLNSFFLNTSGRVLGDTGNDMKRYGGKIYGIINGSSTVEVISGVTGVSIKQIEMVEGGVGKQPRSVAFYQDKILVSCYDGYVDVIDTTSFEVEQRILVGSNPEGLAVSNDKLFVANSGGLNFPNVDSTVSVINLSTFTEELKITVGKNPAGVEVDDQGDVYVITRGDYGSIPSRLNKIDPTSYAVTQFAFNASSIARMNNHFLIGYSDFSTGDNQVGLFNPMSDVMTNATFIDMSAVQALYGITYHPGLDRIFISDAMDFVTTGYVFEFNGNGIFENSYHVGLNPSKIVFYD
ncbi:YncE family protein [bacterium]|nr:YncE family protein [bacterium]